MGQLWKILILVPFNFFFKIILNKWDEVEMRATCPELVIPI